MNKLKNTLSATIWVGLLLSSCSPDDGGFQIPISDGAIIDVLVGGPSQPNQVFVDLSGETQVGVNRSNWDIAFFNGNDHVVILNSSSDVMARRIEKVSFDEVTESDYEGFKEQMSVDAIFSTLFSPPPYPEWVQESVEWIDNPDGNLNDTAIGKVEQEENNNYIYFIARGETPDGVDRGAVLLKVVRTNQGYEILYRSPESATLQAAQIDKTDAYNFVFFNFDDGIVNIQPEKGLWDIAFSTYLEKLDAGGGLLIPYRFQDFVIQNRFEVQSASIVLDENADLLTEYNNYTLAEAQSVEFRTEVNAIGSSWRTVASPAPGSVTGVKSDRFYLIKDTDGNLYKLLFTAMLNTDGERGYPQITYELLN